jgi:antitoxin Phd
MGSWKLQDAKARFSELLNIVLRKGPQIVTRRGVAMAVVVPMDEWRRLKATARPGLKSLLLAEGPRFEKLVPARRKSKRRPPVEFE